MEQIKNEKIDKFCLKFSSQIIQDEYFQFITRNQVSMFSYISYGFVMLQVCVSYMDAFSHTNFQKQQSSSQSEDSTIDADNNFLVISLFVDTFMILIFCVSLYIASRFPKWIDQLIMTSFITYQIQLFLLIIPHLQHKRNLWWEDLQNPLQSKDSRRALIESDIDIAFMIGTFSFMQQGLLMNSLKRWWMKELCVLSLATFLFGSFKSQIGWFNLVCLSIFMLLLASFFYLSEMNQMQRFFEYFIVNKKVHSFYQFVDSSVPLPICVLSIQHPIIDSNMFNQNHVQTNSPPGENLQKLMQIQEQLSSSQLYNSLLNENNFQAIKIPQPYHYTENNLQRVNEQESNHKLKSGDAELYPKVKFDINNINRLNTFCVNSPQQIQIVNNTDKQMSSFPNNPNQNVFTRATTQNFFNKNNISFKQEFCNQRFQKDFLNAFNQNLEIIFDQFIIPSEKSITLGDLLTERYSPENINQIILSTLQHSSEESSFSSYRVMEDRVVTQQIMYECLYNSPVGQFSQSEDFNQLDSLKKQNSIKNRDKRKYQQEQKYRVHILETYWDDSFSVVITFQNISEKISNQQLIKENQYKDQLLFTISHDLKTPLNGMQSILQAALMKDNVEQIKKMIQLVQINGDLLNYLIKDILDYAQVLHKKIKPRPTYFNLQNTLQNIKQTFLYQIQEKGLKLNIINNLSTSFLYTDEIRLKQILFNFLSNALKFTFQGSITIKVEESNDCEEIEDELNNDHDCTQSLNIQFNNNLISTSNSGKVQLNLMSPNFSKSNHLLQQQVQKYGTRLSDSNLMNNSQQLHDHFHKSTSNHLLESDSNYDRDAIVNDELHIIQQTNQNLSHYHSPNIPSNSNYLINQKESKIILTPQLHSNTLQTRINTPTQNQRESPYKSQSNLMKYCLNNNFDKQKQVNGFNGIPIKEQNEYEQCEQDNTKGDCLLQNQHPRLILDQSNNNLINQFSSSQIRRKKNGLNKQISSQIASQVTSQLKNSKSPFLTPSNILDNQDQFLKIQQQINIPQDVESHKSIAVKTYNYKLQQENNDNDIIKITVIDTGLGMDAELQKQLFSMFGTFEQKGVNKEGVGLGLIITQSLSQLLGPKTNNIKVISSKDKGSSFSFKIYRRLQNNETPLNKMKTDPMNNYSKDKSQNDKSKSQRIFTKSCNELEEESEEELAAAINQNDTKKICDYIQRLFVKPTRILIVDDVQFNISVFKCMLHTVQNITFDHAYNGQQAVEKVKNSNFDLIFMDIHMPVMDGISATKVIRQLIEQQKIPSTIIIALTGDDIDSDSSKFCKHGFNAVISKPIKLDDLYIVLKRLHSSGTFG